MDEKMSRQEKWDQTREDIEKLVNEKDGIVKTADLYTLGIDYRRIQSYVKQGILKRIKSGYYQLEDNQQTEDETILRLFPDGILTMESALYAYGYLNKKPYAYQIAINKNTSKSRFKIKYPFVQPYYTEPLVLEMGVTEINFAKDKMKIYTKERLICDCLKYEDKMDREDLKKALKAYIKEPDKDIMQLLQCAKARKVIQKVQSRIGMWL